MSRAPYLHPSHREAKTDQIGTSSHQNGYGNGVLLGNWYEDRFAPKAGDVAVAYPMPNTTVTDDFQHRTTKVRPLMKTADLGKELLLGQGGEPVPLPPKEIDKFRLKKALWAEERDMEPSAHFVTTKMQADGPVARSVAVGETAQRVIRPLISQFSQQQVTDHTHLSLRR